MIVRKRSPAGNDACGAPEQDQLGGPVGSENGLPPHSTQDIRAELVGIDTCIAAGQVARGATPVLAMCRQLIKAGHAPNLSLRAYRGDVLCVTVRRIGEGAHLAVKTAGNGCPIFALDTLQKGAAGPPVRRKAPAHVRRRES
jgi:hypothetical protein